MRPASPVPRHVLFCLLAAVTAVVPGVAAGQSLADVSQEALFAYDASQPLSPESRIARTFDDGITMHDVTFESPRGGRVHASVVVPAGKKKHPVVVFGPWGPGNRSEFLPDALTYARLGAISILVDWPWKRPVPDRRERGSIASPEVEAAVYVQAVVDLRRALDYMATRPDADAARACYVGHSFGAQFGTILTALDARVKGAVLVGGVPDQAAVWVESREPDVVEHLRSFSAEQLDAYLHAVAPFDAVGWVGKIAPRPVLMQFAEYEWYFSRDAMERYAEAAKEPKTVYWYPTGHELNDPQAFMDRMVFVAVCLELKSHKTLGFIQRSTRK